MLNKEVSRQDTISNTASTAVISQEPCTYIKKPAKADLPVLTATVFFNLNKNLATTGEEEDAAPSPDVARSC